MLININPKYKPMFLDRLEIFYNILYGGRAGSKSFTSSIFLAVRLVLGTGNLVYCRQYLTNVQTTIIPLFLLKIKLLNISHLLKVNKDSITCITNGNTLWFKGLETSLGTAEAGMKGIKSLSVVLIDEAQLVKLEAFDRLVGTVRDAGLNLKVVICLNPTDITSWLYKRFFLNLPADDFTGIIGNRLYIYSSYKDSVKFLSLQYIKEILSLQLSNPVKFLNQYLGKWLNNSESALLSKLLLNKALVRTNEVNFQKIVVAIDPATTVGPKSDGTGIAVVGKAGKDYYILLCDEYKFTPLKWALKAKLLYQKYNADFIVYLSNQGGLMVESTLRTVLGNFCKIKSVTATKGKVLRFLPVHALYLKGLIHHCNRFKQLLYQLLTYTGNPRQASPNSVDSMVWGVTSLNHNGNSSFGFA